MALRVNEAGRGAGRAATAVVLYLKLVARKQASDWGGGSVCPQKPMKRNFSYF